MQNQIYRQTIYRPRSDSEWAEWAAGKLTCLQYLKRGIYERPNHFAETSMAPVSVHKDLSNYSLCGKEIAMDQMKMMERRGKMQKLEK